MAAPVVTRIRKPETYRNKMTGNLSAVGEANFKAGILEPKHNPIVEGIKAEPRYKDEMTKVLSEERRKKMLEFSSMEYWGEIADKRAGLLVSGVMDRIKKVDRFWNGWTPQLVDLVGTLDPMDITTFSARKSKMIKNVDTLKSKKGVWLKKITS